MPIEIIGAGYGRTATASLKLALEQLGFGPCHHMSEVLPNPAKADLWKRIGDGEPLWDEAFEGYRSTVDWPACTHWRALAAHYPDAKVILSLRDAGKWFESVNETILNPEACAQMAGSPMGVMLERNIWRLFDGKMDDRAHMTAAFDRHNNEVRQGVPAERLLVFEARDGWGPFARFLGAEPPDAPFPHVNTKEETKKVMEMLASQSTSGDAANDLAGELAEKIYRKRK